MRIRQKLNRCCQMMQDIDAYQDIDGFRLKGELHGICAQIDPRLGRYFGGYEELTMDEKF